MSDKSYVTVEKNRCMVCGKDYDTGAILMDLRLRDKFDHSTLTGNGLCPEHEKLHKDGYIALVECDPEKSTPTGHTIKPENAYRTGVLIHMRRTVARELFNTDIPDSLPMMFIDPDAVAEIKARMPEPDGEEE